MISMKNLSKNLTLKVTIETNGECGPSALDADIWRRQLRKIYSLSFNKIAKKNPRLRSIGVKFYAEKPERLSYFLLRKMLRMLQVHCKIVQFKILGQKQEFKLCTIFFKMMKWSLSS